MYSKVKLISKHCHILYMTRYSHNVCIWDDLTKSMNFMNEDAIETHIIVILASFTVRQYKGKVFFLI